MVQGWKKPVSASFIGCMIERTIEKYIIERKMHLVRKTVTVGGVAMSGKDITRKAIKEDSVVNDLGQSYTPEELKKSQDETLRLSKAGKEGTKAGEQVKEALLKAIDDIQAEKPSLLRRIYNWIIS